MEMRMMIMSKTYWHGKSTSILVYHNVVTNNYALFIWWYDSKAYLSNKSLKGGEFVHGNGHLPHVVGHVGRATQSIGGYGIR